MTDEQIKMLIRVTGQEAKIMLDQEEYSLYKDIQDQMVELVREYGVRLPLNCLQFLYYGNGNTQDTNRGLYTEAPF